MPVVIATVILATRGVDRPGSWRGPDDDGTPLATHQVSSLPSVHPWPRDPDGPGAATLGALEKLAHVHPDRGVHMAPRWLFTMVRSGPRTTHYGRPFCPRGQNARPPETDESRSSATM